MIRLTSLLVSLLTLPILFILFILSSLAGGSRMDRTRSGALLLST